MTYRYRLQIKEPYYIPNILGNKSYPVPTYRWKDIAVSDSREALENIIPETADCRNYKIANVLENIADCE